MIYVNARFLTQEMTGVQRFAEEISLSLRSIRDDVVFVSPPGILREDVAKKLGVEIIGHRAGHAWEQVDLPRYLKKKGSPLLINLCSTAPIFYTNKVVTHHDVIYKRYPQSYSKSFRVFYNTLVPLMLKSSKKLITVSEFSKKEISEAFNYNANNIVVVSNAVNSSFTPSIDHGSKERYLLLVSSKNYHKNFHGAIAAFSQLAGYGNLSLKIIGAANGSFSEMNLTNEHVDNIEFMGRVDDAALIKLYQGALGFVFPSYYEGFGIPPLEAQACGCPVISSNKASMPEVLLDSALYFDPYNIDDIALHMKELIDDENLRSELREKGYLNVKRFSWYSSASKVNEIINELIP
ncbi:glycosyltransferase family 4 protein [Serratia ureilytica]|uniref:glycosyltransferase family 4 protein n=1 Tax=Serratia ureilytica TaxID=300181 RepID=UPI00063B03DE|nr:glycosyltransferase family 1 protein [Serratia ureilytica]KLE40605.1 glycosyl transferase family 1 [Serratia sp. TEL]MBH1913410.1 glycosyltransferase family 4 protein [Serratia ureilytica]MBH2513336.1 glycosyltransferase family 4 protein [Serratia ureilytica]MBH2530244.1 glycosyltransferase family 4 protein [Serratia ureilytica]